MLHRWEVATDNTSGAQAHHLPLLTNCMLTTSTDMWLPWYDLWCIELDGGQRDDEIQVSHSFATHNWDTECSGGLDWQVAGCVFCVADSDAVYMSTAS